MEDYKDSIKRKSWAEYLINTIGVLFIAAMTYDCLIRITDLFPAV